MKESLEKTKVGCIIHIKVKFGNKNKFPAGYDIWKKRILILVNKKPIKDMANNKIIELIDTFFNITDNTSTIVYGKKSREKGVEIKKNMDIVLQMIENGL